MAKINTKETAAEKIARLQAEILTAQNEVAAEETARIEKLASLIREFPKTLGVTTMSEVIALIKAVEKGTLGKIDQSASRSYVRLTSEQRDTVKARLAKGEQVSVIADSMGFQYGTVYAIKKGVTVEVAVTPEVAATA